MNDKAILFAAAQRSLYCFAALAQTVLAPEIPFESSWLNRAVNYELRLLEEGEHPRLLLNVPFGYHIRTLISIARVAWKLGYNPNLRFFIILPNEDAAYLTCQRLMEEFNIIFKSEFYRTIFPYVEASQATNHEIHTGDSGRIYMAQACKRLPTYPVDHIISLGAEHVYDFMDKPGISAEANWLLNTAFFTLSGKPHSSIVVLNRRVSWTDISTLLKSGDYGVWQHLEILHQARETFNYTIRLNGAERTYTPSDGEFIPPDPEGFNPAYESTIQNMAFHGFLFALNDEMPGMWKLFQTGQQMQGEPEE